MVNLALNTNEEVEIVHDQVLSPGGLYNQIILPDVEFLKDKSFGTHLTQRLTVERKIDALKAFWLHPPIEVIWNTELQDEFDLTKAKDNPTSSSAAEDPEEVILYVIGGIQDITGLHVISPILARKDENLTNLFHLEWRFLLLVQAWNKSPTQLSFF